MKTRLCIAFLCASLVVFAHPVPATDLVVAGQKVDAETARFFLLQAVFKSDQATCKRLFGAGLDPNCRFERFPVGSSEREQFSMVGMSIGSPTPLIAATIYRDEEMIRVLIAQGANPNLAVANPVTNEVWTPLKTACIVNSRACCRLLIEHGADPKWKEPVSGRSLAHFALAMRADMSSQDATGADTTRSGPDTQAWIELLTKHGVAADEKDAQGHSARDYLNQARKRSTQPLPLADSGDAEKCGEVSRIVEGAVEMMQLDAPKSLDSLKTIELGADAPLVKAGYLRANLKAPTPRCSYVLETKPSGAIKIRCSAHPR